ncbi:MAG: hypothetical protein ACQES2_11255 [Pseudomonadota bacterium]
MPVLLTSSVLALVGCGSSSGGGSDTEEQARLEISSENATLLATIVMDALERRMDDGNSDLRSLTNNVQSLDEVIGGTGTTSDTNCDNSGSYSTERSAAIDYSVTATNLPGELAGKSVALTFDACVNGSGTTVKEYDGEVTASYTAAHSLNDNQINIETNSYTTHLGKGNDDDSEMEYLYSGQMDYREEYDGGTQVGKIRYTFTDMDMTVAYKGNTADLQEYTVIFRDITLAESYDNNSPSTEERSIDGTIVIGGLTAEIDTKDGGAFDARGDDETQLHVVITGRDDSKMVIKGVDATQVSIGLNDGDPETVQRESLVLKDPAGGGMVVAQ